MNTRCMGCMEEYDEQFEVCPHCGYVKGTPAKEVYHIKPDSLLKERYTIGRVLGYGGFGVTYLAWDTLLDQKVAIKEYLPGDFSTRIPGRTDVSVYAGEAKEQFEKGREKFIDEAKRLARFQHVPGVVGIIDTFLQNNTAYIVMEFLSGTTLKEYLQQQGGRVDYEQAKRIIEPVIDTLRVVHAEGLIHRDISPDNIFITENNEIKLLDFGAARQATSTNSKSLSVILKPGYAPEEQYRSHGVQGPWSDMYALAATFYRMVTGRVPDESLERVTRDRLLPPSKLGAKLPKYVESAIMNALNVKAEERPQNVDEFARALSGGKVDRKEGKRRLLRPELMPLWLKITAPAALAACAVVVALLLTGVIGTGGSYIASSTGESFGSFVNVPGLINNMPEKAQELVGDLNMRVRIVAKLYNDKVEEGTIIFQDPAPGNLADAGQTILVTVSGGQELATVSDVLHTDSELAKNILEGLGFTVKLNQVESDAVANGYVVSQSAAAGERLAYGSEIVLEVSAGHTATQMSTVTVPDVTGKPYEEAVAALREAGLTYAKSAVIYEEDEPTNSVAAQNPAPGQKAGNGSAVLLVVYAGPAVATLPDLQYTNGDAACEMLESLGFKTKIVEQENDTVLANSVIRQEPKAGSICLTSQSVTLYVSKAAIVTVPSVEGMLEADARSALLQAGFSMVALPCKSDEPEGTVLGQSIQAGTQAEAGTLIKLEVSAGPKAIAIPNVVGQVGTDAQKTLRKAGFEVETIYEYSSVEKGKVTRQSPESGEAQRGYKVTIAVSQGREMVNMPGVTGLNETVAWQMLSGFEVNKEYAYSDMVTKGIVISQTPEEKAEVAKGDQVTIVISLGVETFEVANVAGKTRQAATDALSVFKLSVSEQYSDTVAAGKVISQYPAAGTKLRRGDNVSIVVSRGKSTFTEWTDTLPAGISESDYYIETRTLYQSRGKETTTSTSNSMSGWTLESQAASWGNWSNWSASSASASATRQVETRTVQIPSTVTRYHYSRWRYWNTTTNSWWYSYAQYTGEQYGGSGSWQYADSNTAYRTDGSVDGYTRYRDSSNGIWYKQTTTQETVYNNGTEYRYRDQVITYSFYRWSSWSGWAESPISSNATTEVSTKTQYRYRAKR